MTNEKRMGSAKDFINTFAKEFLGIIEFYEKLLNDMGENQNEMLAFIGAIVSSFGDDDSLYISPEQRAEWEKYMYQVEVNVDDDGGIRYSLVSKEENPNAESNSGEDIPA